MKRTLLVVGLLTLVGISAWAADQSVDLTIPFGCEVVFHSGSLDFAPAAQVPGASSVGMGPCDMFWSTAMTWTLYANDTGCVKVETTDFIWQGLDGLTPTPAVFLLANIDNLNCDKEYGVSWTWGVNFSGSMLFSFAIGAERSGFADRAGTYIAEITITCDYC